MQHWAVHKVSNTDFHEHQLVFNSKPIHSYIFIVVHVNCILETDF